MKENVFAVRGWRRRGVRRRMNVVVVIGCGRGKRRVRGKVGDKVDGGEKEGR